MKLRELLKKFQLGSRNGEGRKPIDNVDGLASAPAQDLKGLDSGPGPTAPTNWVPSQQDKGPRH